MKTIHENTQELIEALPEVNSISAYGSGYFKQESMIDEIKTMDLIISVDNPSKWHLQNISQNPNMYIGSGWDKMIDITEIEHQSRTVSFPESLGCFFTTFGDYEYKLLVVDKRLLYKDLKDWSCFSLAGRFQKETRLLVDNSEGVLPALMRLNYRTAARAALLMHSSSFVEKQEFLETVVGLSYMGDFRRRFHFEDPNKIRNIVEGSYDFLEETYLSLPEICMSVGRDDIIYNPLDEGELAQKIAELPSCLRNYLYNVIPKELNDREVVAKTIRRFFKEINQQSSRELALRCNQTVGFEKTCQTVIGKAKKGMQKVKRK